MSLDELIDTARAQIAPHARSLIVTVFGDSIVPHGGRLWMGSLIRLMAPLGINERLVRTAAQRLTVEDWLSGEPIGRRTVYGLTPTGRSQFDAVYQRIYAQQEPVWDGQWRMVLITGAPAVESQALLQLRCELGWMGFGQASADLYVHPTVSLAEVAALQQRLGVTGQSVRWQVPLQESEADAQLRERVLDHHDMATVRSTYEQVLALFQPIEQALRRARALQPQQCFCVRTLLIHLYRRALLKDPQFPDALMPADWPAARARALCRSLYRLTSEPAQRHLLTVVETPDGAAEPANAAYRARFGGLSA